MATFYFETRAKSISQLPLMLVSSFTQANKVSVPLLHTHTVEMSCFCFAVIRHDYFAVIQWSYFLN